MRKLNRSRGWLRYLFIMYGVPALLMITVLPTMHRPGCACMWYGLPVMHQPMPRYACPACRFALFTTLTLPEAPACETAAVAIALQDVVFETAPVAASVSLVNRAHSPPVA